MHRIKYELCTKQNLPGNSLAFSEAKEKSEMPRIQQQVLPLSARAPVHLAFCAENDYNGVKLLNYTMKG